MLNASGGFANARTFEGVVLRCVFRSDPDCDPGSDTGALARFELWPISLRYGERLTVSGIPTVPTPKHARRILADVQRHCAVEIEVVVGPDSWAYGVVPV